MRGQDILSEMYATQVPSPPTRFRAAVTVSSMALQAPEGLGGPGQHGDNRLHAAAPASDRGDRYSTDTVPPLQRHAQQLRHHSCRSSQGSYSPRHPPQNNMKCEF